MLIAIVTPRCSLPGMLPVTAFLLHWAWRSSSVAASAYVIAKRIADDGFTAVRSRRFTPSSASPPSCVAAAAHFIRPRILTASAQSGRDPRLNSLVEMSVGVAIGAITFTGSIIAWGKLARRDFRQTRDRFPPAAFSLTCRPRNYSPRTYHYAFVITGKPRSLFWAIIAVLALSLGILMIIPIGGADMPVIVSMLNSLFRLGGLQVLVLRCTIISL